MRDRAHLACRPGSKERFGRSQRRGQRASGANTAGTADANTEAIQPSKAKSGVSNRHPENSGKGRLPARLPHLIFNCSRRLGTAGRTVRDDAEPGRRCDPCPGRADRCSALQRRRPALAGAACDCSCGDRSQSTPAAVPPTQVKIDSGATAAATAPTAYSASAAPPPAEADTTANAAAATATAKRVAGSEPRRATPADASRETDAALTETVAATAPVAAESHVAQRLRPAAGERRAAGTIRYKYRHIRSGHAGYDRPKQCRSATGRRSQAAGWK